MQHPALGITKLYAFISSRTPDGSEDLLPNDLRFENSADSRDERAYMSRIDFNVAADQGECNGLRHKYNIVGTS